MYSRVSVAELIDSDVPLRPDEAVCIVRDVCRQYAAGALRGIPNPTVIRLTRDGAIVVEGPVCRDQAAVPAAAALLNDLLPGFHSANGFRVPGGLRLVLARASGTLDLPPFAGPGEFSAALERFAASDPRETVRGLFHAWAARQDVCADPQSMALTISDIRRARRATGLTLDDLAGVSGIAASRLRELEWGYMRNWQADGAGRDDLGRYARAAGLDEDLVVSVAWPLIEDETAHARTLLLPLDDDERPPSSGVSEALVPAGPQTLTFVRPLQPQPRPVVRRRLALALAAAVPITVASLSMAWEAPRPSPPPSAARTAPAAPAVTRDVPASAPATAGVRHASYTRTPSAERPAAARPRVRKPASQKPRPARRSFFQKEILRIVIR